MPVNMLVFILYFTKSKDMTADFVKKCNGKEKGVYSFKKYREGISELIWFYYLLVSVIKTNQIKLQDIFDENHILLENKSKFEFTFSIADPPCKIAFEVKSLSCDPFERENCLVIKDGQSLRHYLPFFYYYMSNTLEQDSAYKPQVLCIHFLPYSDRVYLPD